VWGTFESLAALKPDLDAMGGGWAFRQCVTWGKPGYRYSYEDARMWPVTTEHCLFYARERVDISALAWDGVTRDDNSPRAYLNAERERAGFSVRDVAEAFQRKSGSRTVTGMAGHWFGTVQWAFPTEDNYLWLRDLFNRRNGGGYLSREWEDLRREYEDLRREYEDLRREYEDLRYPFHPQQGATDVWEVPICAGKERVKIDGETAHVAQKPLALYERIISASSNPGDLVIDPMAGTGTTAVACKRLGRRSVCVEREEAYAAIARARIAHAASAADDTPAQVSAQPALMEVPA